MLKITENDILSLYDNYELNDQDLVELYSEGYISENTMTQLVESGVLDEYISEIESLEESQELEEGAVTRGLRSVKTAAQLLPHAAALGYHQALAKSEYDNHSKKAERHKRIIKAITYRHNKLQKEDLEKQKAKRRDQILLDQLSKHNKKFEELKAIRNNPLTSGPGFNNILNKVHI